MVPVFSEVSPLEEFEMVPVFSEVSPLEEFEMVPVFSEVSPLEEFEMVPVFSEVSPLERFREVRNCISRSAADLSPEKEKSRESFRRTRGNSMRECISGLNF